MKESIERKIIFTIVRFYKLSLLLELQLIATKQSELDGITDVVIWT